MPYGGHSAIGLIILLNEVAMPHIKNAAYDLSTPAVSSIDTGVQMPTWYFTNKDIFSLFSPSPENGAKKARKNIVHLIHFSKSLVSDFFGFIYRTISFLCRRLVVTYPGGSSALCCSRP
jgi:hypothetical protein